MHRRTIVTAGLVFAGLVGIACDAEGGGNGSPERQIQLITYSPEIPYTVEWHIDGGSGKDRDGSEPVASKDFHKTLTYNTGVKLKVRLTITIPKNSERAYVRLADGAATRTVYVKPGANAASVTKETEQ